MTARLRESAGAPLHDLLHAMKTACEDDDQWWAHTAHFSNRFNPTSLSPIKARC